ITIGPDETICFIVSLDGVPVIFGTSSRNSSTVITISGISDESVLLQLMLLQVLQWLSLCWWFCQWVLFLAAVGCDVW
ncbi:hypothetical protein GBAR_LOCUS8399, partial [Geodia barretti]